MKKEIINTLRNYFFRMNFFPPEILEFSGLLPRKELKKIEALKDKYQGERCFIVGNGPSLLNTPLDLIKEEYTFAFNGIYKNNFGFKPTFLMSTDVNALSQFESDFSEFYKEFGFFSAPFKSKLENHETKFYFRVNRGFNLEKSPHYHYPRFSKLANVRVYEAPSVIFYCLQLAYYLGFKDIYLCGVDFDYSKGTHFDEKYKDNFPDWKKPDDILLSQCFSLAKFVFECDGRTITDLTVGGKLEVFDKCDFYEAIK